MGVPPKIARISGKVVAAGVLAYFVQLSLSRMWQAVTVVLSWCVTVWLGLFITTNTSPVDNVSNVNSSDNSLLHTAPPPTTVAATVTSLEGQILGAFVTGFALTTFVVVTDTYIQHKGADGAYVGQVTMPNKTLFTDFTFLCVPYMVYVWCYTSWGMWVALLVPFGVGGLLAAKMHLGYERTTSDGVSRKVVFPVKEKRIAGFFAAVIAVALGSVPLWIVTLGLVVDCEQRWTQLLNVDAVIQSSIDDVKKEKDKQISEGLARFRQLTADLETERSKLEVKEQELQQTRQELVKIKALMRAGLKQAKDAAFTLDMCLECGANLLDKKVARACGCVGPTDRQLPHHAADASGASVLSMYCAKHKKAATQHIEKLAITRVLDNASNERRNSSAVGQARVSSLEVEVPEQEYLTEFDEETPQVMMDEDRCITCGKALGGFATYRGCGCRGACHRKHRTEHKTKTLSHYCWNHRHEFANVVGPGWAKRVELQAELAKTQQLREADSRKLSELEAERLAVKVEELESTFNKDGLMTAYHGTSLDAALSIQANGFDPDLAGNNAGAMLGKGIYVTSTLEKAMNYAKTKQASGVVLILKVDLGKVKKLRKRDKYMKTWHDHGYDSAFSGENVNGQREEHCIWDPTRIHIVGFALGHTAKARRCGYSVTKQRGKEVLVRHTDEASLTESIEDAGCAVM